MPSTAQARSTDHRPNLELVLFDDVIPVAAPRHNHEVVPLTSKETAATKALIKRVMSGAAYALADTAEHMQDPTHPAPVRLVSEPSASFILSREERRVLQLLLFEQGLVAFEDLEFISAEV